MIAPEIRRYFRLAKSTYCGFVRKNAAASADPQEPASMKITQAAVAEATRGRENSSSPVAFSYTDATRTFKQAVNTSFVGCETAARIDDNIEVAETALRQSHEAAALAEKGTRGHET